MKTVVWEPLKEYSDILFEIHKGIAKITINRPEVYNAFRPETNNQMLEAMDICRERTDIDVIVFTGIGDKAFCSGGDQNVKGVGGYVGEENINHGAVATNVPSPTSFGACPLFLLYCLFGSISKSSSPLVP